MAVDREPLHEGRTDQSLRNAIDQTEKKMAGRIRDQAEMIEALTQEVKRLNREILLTKRTLGLLKREREQVRTLLTSLETRLQTLAGRTREPADAPKKT